MIATKADKLPIITGNTTDIMVALYKLRHDAQQVPSENKALRRCVSLDCEIAMQSVQLRSLPNLETTTGAIKVGIAALVELNDVNSKVHSNVYTSLQKQAASIKQKEDEIKEAYTTFTGFHRERIAEIMNILKDNTKRDDNASGQEVAVKLQQLSKELNALHDKIANQAKDQKQIKKELDTLHLQVYNSIPPTERTERSIESPAGKSAPSSGGGR